MVNGVRRFISREGIVKGWRWCWLVFVFLLVCVGACLAVFFFFSSRRRHTRCGRDWSSDVCSSDLLGCSAECGRCARTIKTIIDEALGPCAKACCSDCPHAHAANDEPAQEFALAA